MAVTELHHASTVADANHVVQSLGPYANEAARLAATANVLGSAFSSADVGRVAQQTDTGAFWKLEGVSPTRWRLDSGPVPIHNQTGTTYTLAISDADAKVILTNAGAIALTIPTNASVPFKPGDSVRIKQGGAGAVTVAGAGGVTVHAAGTLITGGQYSELVLECEATDVWAVFGKST